MAAEDRGPQLAAVAILFLTLAWIFVSLRCYVRTVMIKSFGMDDWLAVASLVLFTLYCTFVLKGIQYGHYRTRERAHHMDLAYLERGNAHFDLSTGQHLVNLPPENIPKALKWWWCCELAYISCTTVLKASIAIFLTRICIKRSQIITIWTVVVAVILFSIFYFFVVVFQCAPVTFFWTQYEGVKGKCVNPRIITGSTYAHSALSAFADCKSITANAFIVSHATEDFQNTKFLCRTLGTLPIFLVWDLAMNPRTKVSVALILALGALGSTATIVRIPYIKQLAQNDFLYSTTDVAIWSTVEPGIGITAAAMATLRPLFRTFLSRSKLFGASSRSRNTNHPWSSSRKTNRAGYFRSASGPKDTELGLRSDISKGVGVTTIIKSSTNQNFVDSQAMEIKGAKRSDSVRELRWNESLGHMKDDSSEEFLPMQRPNNGDWGIRKTTDIVTSREKEAMAVQDQ